MSRLLKKMKDYVTVNGQEGKSRLALAAGRGEQMIDRYLKGQSIPPEQARYDIALTMGCTHEEALELAQELPESEGKAS